jgi:hypothetical protein
MTGYDFTRFAFQGCFGIHVFKCFQFCITSTSNTSHEEMKQTALKRDEEQVQAIVNHLNETMTDPFDIRADF